MKIKIIAICSVVIAFMANVHAGWLTDLLPSSLTDAQKEWHMSERGVGTSDPLYPLKVISDGYKMIEIYREPERKRGSGPTWPAYDAVNWGWKLTVKNVSANKLNVTVNYTLMDADGFKVAYATPNSEWVTPGNTVTIQSTASMPYDQLKRVTQSSWSLSYY